MNKRLERVHEKAMEDLCAMEAYMDMLTTERYRPLTYDYDEQIRFAQLMMGQAELFICHMEILREAKERGR
ncbi:MAG: hypothetical protein NC311_10595 [Muribaculaceae bacterium]|nr:hypothetical protein [Muribaculaceae bacterium]